MTVTPPSGILGIWPWVEGTDGTTVSAKEMLFNVIVVEYTGLKSLLALQSYLSVEIKAPIYHPIAYGPYCGEVNLPSTTLLSYRTPCPDHVAKLYVSPSGPLRRVQWMLSSQRSGLSGWHTCGTPEAAQT